jgi:hypothetical protein
MQLLDALSVLTFYCQTVPYLHSLWPFSLKETYPSQILAYSIPHNSTSPNGRLKSTDSIIHQNYKSLLTDSRVHDVFNGIARRNTRLMLSSVEMLESQVGLVMTNWQMAGCQSLNTGSKGRVPAGIEDCVALKQETLWIWKYL